VNFYVYIANVKLHLIANDLIFTQHDLFKVFDRITDVDAPAHKNFIAIQKLQRRIRVCFRFLKFKFRLIILQHTSELLAVIINIHGT